MLGWHRTSPFGFGRAGVGGTGHGFAWPVFLSAGCLCLTACNSGMSRIDLETQKLMAQRSSAIGGGAVAPEARPDGDIGRKNPAWAAKTVPTTNPDGADLSYDIASESRDVAARLEGYQAKEAQLRPGETARHLSLTEALRVGQQSASEYLAAEEAYILAAISLLTTRHQWSPRLFNDTSFTVSGQGTDGSFQNALKVVNNLRVSKQLPFGGAIEASWLTQATQQLQDLATGGYVQSSQLALSGNIPLLRGAGDVAQEGLVQAERNLIYQARSFEAFRRDFLIAIAADYFGLLQSRAEIANQEEAFKNLKNIEREKAALFEAGRVSEYEKNNASNQVLTSIATLAGQKEAYILQLERFKIRLGMNSQQAIELDPAVLDIPEPEVTLEKAVEFALMYRLDLQNQRDQLDDAKRAVANAKNQTLPDLNATASVGVPTDPRRNQGGLSFSPNDSNYQAGVTLGLPLDREAERLGVRAATIALQTRQRDYERFRDELAVGVRQDVRNIDLKRFQLTLAEKAVEINQRRIKETELKADEVTTQTRVDAATQLQQSQNQRDAAKTALRNTILQYLRDSGQLRVAKDGTFQPLPGMQPIPTQAEPAKGQ